MREKIVSEGASLSAVMKELPIFITPETTAMVRAGEIGGILDEAASILADWIDVSSAKKDIELSFWLRSIGSLIDAGVPLDLALAWGVEYPVSPAATAVLEKLIKALQNEQPLSPIVDQAQDIFPHPIRLAIRAGEQGQCLGYAFQWAGREVATGICSRLMGVEATFKNRSTKETEKVFIDSIVAFTKADCADDRRSSIDILCSLEATNYVDEITACLSDSAPLVRIAAIQTLARFGDRASIDPIAECLTDSDADVKRNALIALADLKANHLSETMSFMIRDADAYVKSAAIESVIRMGELKTLVRVSSEVLLSEAPEGHFMASIVLRDHADEVDPDVLLHALKDQMPVALNAAYCLVDQNRTEGLPLMREALATGWWPYWTAVWLEKAKDVKAAPLIRDAVKRGELHPSWMERADKLEARL
jgi:HEAT repeat protein